MDGGLGAFILGFTVVTCAIFAVLGFVAAKFLFKFGILKSILVALMLAVVGFFAGPYLFELYLDFRGISIL